MRVLVVEDDRDVAGFVLKGLREAGHVAEHADNGRDGLFMAASEPFDAIILDRMLPGGFDGLRVLETLRAQDNQTPVLFLSAMAQLDDRVRGLKAGGDDYLTKPFAFSELLARVEALARRSRGTDRRRSSWWGSWKWTCCRGRCGGRGRSSICNRGSSGCWSI